MPHSFIAQARSLEKLVDNFLVVLNEDPRVVLLPDRSKVKDVEASLGIIRNELYLLMLKIERLKLSEK
ncbi:hypothetical protein MUP59_02085 [Candidatus Bathyarchaeota archaeon]|nr:hypothetical protein [Candidatus Bathyarchaeota archaeon]